MEPTLQEILPKHPTSSVLKSLEGINGLKYANNSMANLWKKSHHLGEFEYFESSRCLRGEFKTDYLSQALRLPPRNGQGKWQNQTRKVNHKSVLKISVCNIPFTIFSRVCASVSVVGVMACSDANLLLMVTVCTWILLVSSWILLRGAAATSFCEQVVQPLGYACTEYTVSLKHPSERSR